MENEIWKDIQGYEGFYKVSSLGRIKSLRSGKILSIHKNNREYLVVHLSVGSKAKHLTIHRLVAIAFIPNPNNYPQVNHISEDKNDNTISNLEWCSASYNVNYGNRNNKARKSMLNNSGHSKKIAQVGIQSGQEVARFLSMAEAKRKTGYDDSSIRKCCIGERKTAYGYKWKYI